MDQSLDIALKEWATVCHALEVGRQVILLRKGGQRRTCGEGGRERQHVSSIVMHG